MLAIKTIATFVSFAFRVRTFGLRALFAVPWHNAGRREASVHEAAGASGQSNLAEARTSGLMIRPISEGSPQ